MKTICVAGLAFLMSGCVSFTAYESSVKATPGTPSPTAVSVETSSMSAAEVVEVLKVLPLEEWFTGWGDIWQALIGANESMRATTKLEKNLKVFHLELKQ